MSILQQVIDEYGISQKPEALTDRTDKSVNSSEALPDKTDKRASVGSVSEWSEQFETEIADWEPHELPAAIEVEEIRLARLSGAVPTCYTSSTTCSRCGPVPIWEGCPPDVLGCPWCFNRIKGLPMPMLRNAARGAK